MVYRINRSLLVLTAATSMHVFANLAEELIGDDACSDEASEECSLALHQLRGQLKQQKLEVEDQKIEMLSNSSTTGSCHVYGCVGYSSQRLCQCNPSCSHHGNCCSDYTAFCTPALHASAPVDIPKRLKIVNNCSSEPLWIAHMALGGVGPDPQDIKIEPGQSYSFQTPSNLKATRYWPKMGCDEKGANCALGDSGGTFEACIHNPHTGNDDYSRCSPPVDTKFEATFGENGEPCNPQAPGGVEMKGCDFVDISLVDGWTLPVKFEVDGDCKTNKDEKVDVIDCSELSLNECPSHEILGGHATDLRAINPITEQVSGCYSPCTKLLDTKWSNKELSFGRKAEEPLVAPYCCPTPPESPDACRSGPIVKTSFLKAVHEKCPGVYGYAYDDGMGLMRCSSATIYTVTFYCPAHTPKPHPSVAKVRK